MRRLAVALLPLCFAAIPARAAEFIAGWDAHAAWDSNILRTTDPTESAFSLRTGPDIRVREEQGDLRYDVDYNLRYEAFAEVKGINAFDQIANGYLSWRAGPRTDLTVSDNFGYVTNLNGVFAIAPGAIAGVIVPGRERVTYNTGSATLTHRLSALWQLQGSFSNDMYGYQNPLQNDSTSNVASLQMTRAISPRTIIGAGASYTRQQFDAVVDQPGGGSTFIQGFGVFNHNFSPSFTLSVQAGPALTMPEDEAITKIDTSSYFALDPTTCDVQLPDGNAIASQTNPCQQSTNFNLITGRSAGLVPPSKDTVNVPFIQTETVNDSLNYFGSVSLAKYWEQWNVRFSYSRQASGASGLGTSTTLDSFQGNVTWSPSRNWEVNFLTSYATQAAASEQPEQLFVLTPSLLQGEVNGQPTVAIVGVPVEVRQGKQSANAFEVTTVRAELRGFRRLSRRLTLDGGVTWWQQETSGDFFASSKRDAFRVDIGFIWNFDPIPL